MLKKLVPLLFLFVLLSGFIYINGLPGKQPTKPYEPEAEETAVFVPDHALTPKETVKAFFNQQYDAYTSMKYIDLSEIMDVSELRNRNALVWLQTLIKRRRLIADHNLCYVETKQYPYTIHFQEKPEDNRLKVWMKQGLGSSKGEITLHFTITGEKGKAYPPMMAMNAQHTMRLKQIDGVWKITFHYFPGSERRFLQSGTLKIPSTQEMLDNLYEEFVLEDTLTGKDQPKLPSGAATFDGVRAAEYAKVFTETPNEVFYDIGDWMGNCANFISQCVWFGFESCSTDRIRLNTNMTNKWFAGRGGGSPAWENVGHFWDYATTKRKASTRGLHGEVVQGVLQLKPGGVVQVRTGPIPQSGESFNHSLILVDTETLMLAQNSPDCFLYYSDLVNADARFFNPQYFID